MKTETDLRIETVCDYLLRDVEYSLQHKIRLRENEIIQMFQEVGERLNPLHARISHFKMIESYCESALRKAGYLNEP